MIVLLFTVFKFDCKSRFHFFLLCTSELCVDHIAFIIKG